MLQAIVRKISGSSVEPPRAEDLREQQRRNERPGAEDLREQQHRNDRRAESPTDDSDQEQDPYNYDNDTDNYHGRHKESHGRDGSIEDSRRAYDWQGSSHDGRNNDRRQQDRQRPNTRSRRRNGGRRPDTGTSSELSRSLHDSDSLRPESTANRAVRGEHSRSNDSTDSRGTRDAQRDSSLSKSHADHRSSKEKKRTSSVSASPRERRSRAKSFDEGASKQRRRRKSMHPNADADKNGGRKKSLARRRRSMRPESPADSDGPEPGTCGRRHTRVIKNTVTQPKLFRTLAHENLRVFGWTVDMPGTLHSVAKMFNGYTGWVEFAPTSNMRHACEKLRSETINEDAVDRTNVKNNKPPAEAGYLYAFCGTRSERCTAPQGNDTCESGQGDWVDKFAIGWLLKQKALRGLHTSL